MTPEQLKASILQRAMEGKLVPQDPNDEPASELLKRIKKEKERLIKEGKIKRDKNETEIFRGDDGLHYEKFADGTMKAFNKNIPKGWEIAHFTDICMLEKGSIKRGPFGSSITKSMFVPKAENTYKVYEQGNAIQKNVNYGDYWLSEKDFARLEGFSVKSGDIIVSCAGTIGESYVVPKNHPKGVINQALLRLRLNSEVIYTPFFLLVFKSLVDTLKANSIGSAIKNLASVKYLKYETPFLLPPISEQKRIVDKIRKIDILVSEYQLRYNELTKLNKQFPEKLRKSILQYAMQGKLVSQYPNDEPVEVLLDKIRAEKQRLYKEGKLKKKDLEESIIYKGDDNLYYEKQGKIINAIEVPFEIPESWKFSTLKNVSVFISSKNHQIKTNEIISSGKIPVVSQGKSLIDGYTNDEGKILKISEPILLFGDHTRCVKHIDFSFVIGADGAQLIKPIALCTKYLYQVLTYTANTIRNRGYARHFSLLKQQLLPIPPLEEQIKIHKKIEILNVKINLLA